MVEAVDKVPVRKHDKPPAQVLRVKVKDICDYANDMGTYANLSLNPPTLHVEGK